MSAILLGHQLLGKIFDSLTQYNDLKNCCMVNKTFRQVISTTPNLRSKILIGDLYISCHARLVTPGKDTKFLNMQKNYNNAIDGRTPEFSCEVLIDFPPVEQSSVVEFKCFIRENSLFHNLFQEFAYVLTVKVEPGDHPNMINYHWKEMTNVRTVGEKHRIYDPETRTIQVLAVPRVFSYGDHKKFTFCYTFKIQE